MTDRSSPSAPSKIASNWRRATNVSLTETVALSLRLVASLMTLSRASSASSGRGAAKRGRAGGLCGGGGACRVYRPEHTKAALGVEGVVLGEDGAPDLFQDRLDLALEDLDLFLQGGHLGGYFHGIPAFLSWGGALTVPP